MAAVYNRTRTSLASGARGEGLSQRTLRLLPIAVLLAIGLLAVTGCSGDEEAKEEDEESQAPSQE